ncbi:probable glucan endo-1,3-beta-glucosidase BG5 [Momordica charantia]|uniref:glucan endo-1,3-beta-D-glucosidase n=1 Tax=Momordica charantia TaxID=3673 RepID=A0A6J1C4V7_MOMCH|nr:probable glucan endo-1,3-beta-glucosidase BG5 [Momordica charantia]
MAKLAHIIVFFMASMSAVRANDVLLGVYYGLFGDNVPPPWKVVQLCVKYNIRRIRLDEPNLEVFDAFCGAGIDISFGVPNDMLINMKANESAVVEWFNTYVEPYIGDFVINYIIVGNKAIPGLDDCILPVMKSLQNLLNARYLGQVKLTTLVGYNAALAVKDPPSSGAFDPNASDNIREILRFLLREGSPLMVSVCPYTKYAYSNRAISLNYATFGAKTPVVHDGGLSYDNLFDAMVDPFYAAMDKLGVGDVDVAVGETGWPTCGNGNIATPQYASAYNKNFKSHISSGRGTPKRPNVLIRGFIKSMFNENKMPEGESQCYGIFNVDSTPLYPLF